MGVCCGLERQREERGTKHRAVERLGRYHRRIEKQDKEDYRVLRITSLSVTTKARLATGRVRFASVRRIFRHTQLRLQRTLHFGEDLRVLFFIVAAVFNLCPLSSSWLSGHIPRRNDLHSILLLSESREKRSEGRLLPMDKAEREQEEEDEAAAAAASCTSLTLEETQTVDSGNPSQHGPFWREDARTKLELQHAENISMKEGSCLYLGKGGGGR